MNPEQVGEALLLALTHVRDEKQPIHVEALANVLAAAITVVPVKKRCLRRSAALRFHKRD